MNLKKLIAAGASAGILAFAGVAQAAPSFALDLTVLATATDAYTGDGKAQNIDALQFVIGTNAVDVTFFGATPDFALGSTFTFTDTGTILGTALLPPGFGTDYEGFGSTWTLNGAFSLAGVGEVIDVNVDGSVVFDYTFQSGGLSIDYVDLDESITVMTADFLSGNGLVDVKAGTAVSTAGGFTFTSVVNDLLDGFWLQPGGAVPYMDGLTLVVADGNVDKTTTTVTGFRQYSVDATSDGSASLEQMAVPEPGSLALVALALVAAGGVARRRR